MIVSKSYFQKHKGSAQSLNFDWMWLVNELVLTFSAPIECAKAQFNLIILSRVIPHTTYYRQTDRHFRKNCFFWLRGSQNVKISWKFRVIFHIKPIPSHPWWKCKKIQNLKSYRLVKWGVKKRVRPSRHDSNPYSHLEQKKRDS